MRISKFSGKEYIFVDFFDTVCFRHIHSHQVDEQWAKVVKVLYPSITYSEKELRSLRNDVSNSLRKLYKEPPYKEVMYVLWNKLGGAIEEREEFVSKNLEVDVAIELGCQYANRKIRSLLSQLKKDGKKIYIVSDFYLPKETYYVFTKYLGCEGLFYGIYVSESCNCTKWDGSLYEYILNDLHVEANKCIMIGDSRHSDVKMANANGIDTVWYFPLRHKLWTNFSKKLRLDYGNRIIRVKANELYQQTCYQEYVIVLMYVISKLHKIAWEDRVRILSFLSRGGYLLKKLFDVYQELCLPQDSRIKTEYCYNSRKVCLSARENHEARSLLRDYLGNFTEGRRLAIVDEGWYNHSQQAITRYADYDTIGYYIGTCAKEKMDVKKTCDRKGLLFDVKENGEKTKYFGVFCSNRSMYEQILTAPHGSVDKYIIKNGSVVPLLKENDKEKYLYEHCIYDMQESMLKQFKGIAVWQIGKRISLRLLARMVLKSLFFAKKERLEFMNLLDACRYDNHTDGKARSDKGLSDVRINPIELIIHPDRYAGMFCKLQRKLAGHRVLSIVYYPIAFCFYIYIRLISRI